MPASPPRNSGYAEPEASLTAGRKLATRGVTAPHVELVTAPAGSDPADILASHGADRLAATLADPQRRGTLLDLLVDEQLDHYDWSPEGTTLRKLPVASHAAYHATQLVAETVRARLNSGDVDPSQIRRQLTHIAERTRVDLADLNSYMVTVAFPDDDHVDLEIAELSNVAASGVWDSADAEPEFQAVVDVEAEITKDTDDGRDTGIE